MNIRPKDKVACELVEGEVRVKPVRSRLLAGHGAIKPKARPEDFRKMRREVEEDWADEVGKEA